MLGIDLGFAGLSCYRTGAGTPAPAPAPTPLAFTPLHDFESVGTSSPINSALSQHTGSRKARGLAGLRVLGTGSNGTFGAGSNATTAINLSAAGHTRLLFAMDIGDGPLNEVTAAKPALTVGGTTYDPRFDSGVTVFEDALPFQRGRVWVGYGLSELRNGSYAGASVLSAGAATKTYDQYINTMTDGSRAGDVVLDAAVFPAGYKPSIVLTFDDANVEQYTNMFPAMQTAGLKGSLYVPFNLVENTASLTASAARLTRGQIAAMRTAGWSIGVDSDPTDKPLTAYATVAATIAQLNAHRDTIVAQWGDTAGAKHVCYSYGNIGYYHEPIAFWCTSDGSANVTSPTNNPFTFLAPGMYIFNGAGTLLGTVTAVTGQSAFTASANIAAAGQSLTFVGATAATSATCNGTTTVTVGSTLHMIAGMEVRGYTVPAGTTIVSVNSGTQITVSQAIPATCVRLRAVRTAGEFWPTKLLDALIAAGYRTGRKNINGAYATPWGADPKVQICTPSYSMDFIDANTTANLLKQIDACVAAGRDMVLFGHKPLTGEMAGHWQAIINKVKSHVDGGTADCQTLAEWQAKVDARGAIA